MRACYFYTVYLVPCSNSNFLWEKLSSVLPTWPYKMFFVCIIPGLPTLTYKMLFLTLTTTGVGLFDPQNLGGLLLKNVKSKRIWKVPFFHKIHFEYILIWNYWKNHVKSVLKTYNWWLQGHCLWVYRVPQVGMEADATAQFCLVMLEYATILSHMHCYHVTPLMPAGDW